MAATIKVKLGDREFDVPRFNIGQIEELAEIWEAPNPRKHPYAILRLALSRCGLSADEVSKLDIEVDDLSRAVRAILKHSGFATKDDPPNADPPVPQPGAGESTETAPR